MYILDMNEEYVLVDDEGCHEIGMVENKNFQKSAEEWYAGSEGESIELHNYSIYNRNAMATDGTIHTNNHESVYI